MKKALILAAAGEGLTGLALLLVPSLVGQVLLGEQLTGVAIPVARVAGTGADWPERRLLARFAARRHVVLQHSRRCLSCLPRSRRWGDWRPSMAGGCTSLRVVNPSRLGLEPSLVIRSGVHSWPTGRRTKGVPAGRLREVWRHVSHPIADDCCGSRAPTTPSWNSVRAGGQAWESGTPSCNRRHDRFCTGFRMPAMAWPSARSGQASGKRRGTKSRGCWARRWRQPVSWLWGF